MGLLSRLVKSKRKNALLERIPDDLVVRVGAIALALTSVPELRLLRTLVDKRRHAVDVGANRGVFTYALSLLADGVTAYEPNPELAARIRALSLDGVSVREKALSSRAGTATLTIPLVDGRHLDTRASFHVDDDAGRRIDVPLARLLARDRPTLLVEIEQRFFDRSIHELFAFVESHGYRGAYLTARGLVPLTRFDVERDQLRHLPDVLHQDYVNNFVFRPVERR